MREKLEKQLRALKRQGIIDVWHDREISAGTEWEREIDKHLNSAQIILLMVSPDFMDSDYCYSIEMKRAMERHERGEARVIPVILRPVYWQGAPFGKLQALPTDAKPIMSRYWHNLDEAFYDVAKGISKAIEKLEPSPEASSEIKQFQEIVPFEATFQTHMQAAAPGQVQKTIDQWLDEGDNFRNLKQYSEALAAYEQAIRLDPNDAYAYFNKGYTLIELKRFREALAAYEQAIHLDPNLAVVYQNKGNALNGLNRKREAQGAYEKARQLGYSG